MCGIAGIVSFKENVKADDIKKMTNALIHRGPNGEGQWINSEMKVGLGHRRLAIIDLSSNASQPMSYCEGRLNITFNGEIYNYIELRELLKLAGYTFKSNSDAEVILASYHYWGEKCLQMFDGMFAFAIWDELKQELFCARDRFGEKPFYYCKSEFQFVFASEMKAIFSLEIKKEVNNKRVYDYLLYLNVEDPYKKNTTFFQNIEQLPPAHFFKLKLDAKASIKYIEYWKLDSATTFTGNEEEAEQTFKKLFLNAIKKCLRSDVPHGSSLSGGLDSSAIVCSVNEILGLGTEQHTFSARFEGYVKDEGEYIAEVIKHCNKATIIHHEVYPTSNSMIKNIDKIMFHQEEPFGSASIAAQFEVMQLAANNNVKVLLDGQGADEVLAGYPIYLNSFLRQSLKQNYFEYKRNRKEIKSVMGYNINLLNLDGVIKTYFYDTYKNYNSKKNIKRELNSLFYLGMHPSFVKENRHKMNTVYSPPNLKQHLHFILTKRGLNELLRYADRNSMANSVEVRLPFLDHHLVEFVFSLPEKYFINNGWTKFILRKSMKEVLPEKIRWRKDKIGFEPPQENWLKNSVMENKLFEAQQKLIQKNILIDKKHELNWHHLMVGMIYG